MNRRRRFTLRDAILLAVILHAIPLLMELFFQKQIQAWLHAPPEMAERDKPMKFKFVDDDKEYPLARPEESEFLSDRDRTARTETRSEKVNDAPRMTGQSREFLKPRPPQPRARFVPPSRQTTPTRERTTQTPGPQTLKEKLVRSLEKAIPEQTLPQSNSNEGKTIRTLLDDLPSLGYKNPDGSISLMGTPSFSTSAFDFGPYAKRLYFKVRSNWRPSDMVQYFGREWKTVVEFEILRDGSVDNLRVTEESGIESYDREALYAIISSYPLENLPKAYEHDRVGVRWTFYYHVVFR